MLDLATTLTDASPRPVVHAVSRHALLPRGHRGAPAAATPPVPPCPSSTASRFGWPPWSGRSGPRRPSTRATGRTSSTPCARRSRPCGSGCRPATSACSCAATPATGRCTGTACRPRPRRGSPRCAPPGRLWCTPARSWPPAASPDGVRVSIADGGNVTELDGGWLINGTGPAADVTAVADPAAARPAGRRPGPARPAAAGPGRRRLRRAPGRGGPARRPPVHARAAAAGHPLRDDRHRRDRLPGRGAGPAPRLGELRPGPPRQRRLAPPRTEPGYGGPGGGLLARVRCPACCVRGPP